jgi:hypothetical protein
MGYELLTKACIHQNVFNTVATLLNTCKPSGWTVVSAFPEQDPAFPCFVVNPAEVNSTALSVNRNKQLNDISVIIDVVALGCKSKRQVDQGIDNVRCTLLCNHSCLRCYGLSLANNMLVDGSTDGIEINGKIFNMQQIRLNFRGQV